MNPDTTTPWALFWESSPRWSSALRAILVRTGDMGLARQVHSVKEPPEGLRRTESPTLVAVEITPGNAREAVGFLSQCRATPVLCAAALASVEPASRDGVRRGLLEAGAALVLFSPHESDQLAPLARRHAARFAAESRGQESIVEQVRRRLPWQSPPWAIG